LASLPPQPERSRTLVLLAVVLAATFVVYSGTLNFQFVFDDVGQIVGNQLIREARFVPHYFQLHVWGQVAPNLKGNYYRPVFVLWLFLNYQLFGLNPLWWHVTTVLMHVGATALVFFLCRKLLRDDATALVAAALFGLHPVHIEAVAWISGVSEPLHAILFLGTLLSYIRARERRSSPWLAASLVLYVVTMLSKETALVLPAFVLLYEWLYRPGQAAAQPPPGQRLRSALLLLSPYVLLSLLYVALRIHVLEGFSHALTQVPLRVDLLTFPSLLWFYTRLLVYPTGLSAFYDTPYIASLDVRHVLLPLLGVAAIACGLWYWWRRSRRPEVAFASLLLIIPLLPLFNLDIFRQGDITHDRYLYLPSLGFCILVALAIQALPARGRGRLGAPALRVVLTAALVLFYAVGVVAQNVVWADNLLLYYRGVTRAPNNNLARMNLANEVLQRGMPDQAIALYQQVLQRDPNDWLCLYNLGYAYYRIGRYQDAERVLSRATFLNQNDADTFFYLGLAKLKLDKLQDAEILFRTAIDRDPRARGYRYSLGLVLERERRLREALPMFQAELAKYPSAPAPREHIASIEKQLAAQSSR
jgi:tetratricopeptide (TPR) repeat protein